MLSPNKLDLYLESDLLQFSAAEVEEEDDKPEFFIRERSSSVDSELVESATRVNPYAAKPQEVYLNTNLFIHLLYIYVSFYLSMYSSIYLCIRLSIYPSIYVCIHLSIYVSIYLSMYPSIYLCIRLSIYVSI